uniref:Syntaxin 6 n=1 Tax=Callithrix jacchus TaxID=9483 RepID=A0A2R8MPL5_CALJA
MFVIGCGRGSRGLGQALRRAGRSRDARLPLGPALESCIRPVVVSECWTRGGPVHLACATARGSAFSRLRRGQLREQARWAEGGREARVHCAPRRWRRPGPGRHVHGGPLLCGERDMKDQMSASSVQALAERKNRQALLGDSGSQNWSTGTTDKYGRLDRELQRANSHFIEEQQAQQQLIVEQQDEQLELVSGSIGVLKNMSQRIGGELEEQAVMLEDFSHELESTQSRLDNVMKKLAKVSHMTSDRRQWCAIAILFAVLLVVLILFLVL